MFRNFHEKIYRLTYRLIVDRTKGRSMRDLSNDSIFLPVPITSLIGHFRWSASFIGASGHGLLNIFLKKLTVHHWWISKPKGYLPDSWARWRAPCGRWIPQNLQIWNCPHFLIVYYLITVPIPSEKIPQKGCALLKILFAKEADGSLKSL